MKENTTKRHRKAHKLFACEFALCFNNLHPPPASSYYHCCCYRLCVLIGVAWVLAALVRNLICPTCSSVSYWVALTCSACASVGPLQPLPIPPIQLPPPHSFPLMPAICA